jgi:hypothetical protein
MLRLLDVGSWCGMSQASGRGRSMVRLQTSMRENMCEKSSWVTQNHAVMSDPRPAEMALDRFSRLQGDEGQQA